MPDTVELAYGTDLTQLLADWVSDPSKAAETHLKEVQDVDVKNPNRSVDLKGFATETANLEQVRETAEADAKHTYHKSRDDARVVKNDKKLELTQAWEVFRAAEKAAAAVCDAEVKAGVEAHTKLLTALGDSPTLPDEIALYEGLQAGLATAAQKSLDAVSVARETFGVTMAKYLTGLITFQKMDSAAFMTKAVEHAGSETTYWGAVAELVRPAC